MSDPTGNRAPVVSGPGAQTVVEGEGIRLQIVAADPNDDPITYSALNLPPGLSVDPSTGVVSGTIAAGAAAGSPYASTLRASDGTLIGSRNANWTVTATGAFNTAPTVTDPGDQTATEGDAVSLPITATDPDPGNVLMYSATGLPPGLWLNCTSGVIAGTIAPGAASGSPYTVRVSANDQVVPGSTTFHSKWDSQSFTWAVSPAVPNEPPVITNPGNQTNNEGAVVSLQVSATDPDGGPNPLTFSATGLPPGLSIGLNTGLIGGTIGAGAGAGSPYQVQVSASDGLGSDTETFGWTVIDPPPAAPTGLTVTPDTGGLGIDWANNTEPDLGGYNVYRLVGGSPVKLNAALLTNSAYYDTGAPPGATSTYRVTAVDLAGHEVFARRGSGARSKVAFRGASTASVKSANALTVPRPTGVQAGDVMLAAITVNGSPASITPPVTGGWTLLRDEQSGSALRQYVFWKVAGAEPASYTWTFPAKFPVGARSFPPTRAWTPAHPS